jgi:hypothetical protein
MEPENSLRCLQEPESPRSCVAFRDMLFSYNEELLTPPPTLLGTIERPSCVVLPTFPLKVK